MGTVRGRFDNRHQRPLLPAVQAEQPARPGPAQARPGRRRRQAHAVGLLAELVEVDRPDGTRGPWQPALQGRDLWLERTALRNACFIFTIALSMMRDNEVRAILKDSVVEYYSSPAVKSTKRKLDPDLPTRHWWIIKPVAKAIDIASQLSLHDKLAFASVNEGDTDAIFDSQKAIDSFIKHVNRFRHRTGLAEIPVSKATPHMFRKTMAMLTRDYPGSEIAVGMQLQHVATRALANRTTQGYMENLGAQIRAAQGTLPRGQPGRERRLRSRGRLHARNLPGSPGEGRGTPQHRAGTARRHPGGIRPAQADEVLDPFRQAQPLHDGRRQPCRREVSRRRGRPCGTSRASA
ncbi:hypothetical protein ACF1G0_32745 [Streptomyces sp. NPDC013953]|uniref:hypothetical protein n=1 Tax=Streptomyces sp. NPDC013953 TaxID=3364868 RepID=UPI0036F65606